MERHAIFKTPILQNWFQKKNEPKRFALKMKCSTPYVLLTFEEGTSIL